MEEAELEKLGKEYQLAQEQLRALAIQKEQFSLQKEEHAEALAELEKATGKTYVSIGGVMVETSREHAIAEVKERGELISARLASISKQCDEAEKRGKALKDKFYAALNVPADTG